MNYKVDNYKYVGLHYDEAVITIEVIPNFFDKLAGYRSEKIEYEGSGTVWHNTKTFRRASTDREGLLADMNHAIRKRNFNLDHIFY